MKKVTFFLLTLGLIFFAYNAVSYAEVNYPSGSTVGISRNPESCYQCHASHIITIHNENILSNPVPLDMNCNICHAHITTVTEIGCDACHTNHPFGKLNMDRPVGTWSMTGPMSSSRFDNTAGLLADGRFMVVGGAKEPYFEATNTADILDPQTRLFTSTGLMSTPRVSHQQTTMANGKVLLTAGRNAFSPFLDPNAKVLDTAEIYDPVTNIFFPAGNLLNKRRSHRDILLNDGRVLITGGTTAVTGDPTSISLKTAEIYDPATGMFSSVGDMNVARQSHHLIKLLDGKVLVIGGGEGDRSGKPLDVNGNF